MGTGDEGLPHTECPNDPFSIKDIRARSGERTRSHVPLHFYRLFSSFTEYGKIGGRMGICACKTRSKTACFT